MEKQAPRSRQEIIAAIKDLKARMPAHSVKPGMISELEELEELLSELPHEEDNSKNPN